MTHAMPAGRLRVSLLVIASLLLAGCAHIIAPMSDRDVDRHHGQRTLGSRIEDSAIERKTWINIRRNPSIPRTAHVVVVSWNGQVLLAGQAPDVDAKALVEETAAAIRHVVQVHNEMTVGPRTRALPRLHDSWITARVKARLLFGPDVPGRRIKVVTENGVVYLMGLLDHAEAGMAVETARGVYGVQKIVKIFEYIEVPDEGTGN